MAGYTDPHDHRREPVSAEEAEQAASKGLIWDAQNVAFRQPETRAEAAQVDPAAPVLQPTPAVDGSRRSR